jgi:hypothetical protein
METLVADFYAGFEGEPEVTFVRTGNREYSLRSWDGYFSQVLDAIEPGVDSKWHGLVLHYHLETGWYDEEEFEVEDVELFATQLATLNTFSFEPATNRFYEALCLFVQSAAANKDKLVIKFF